MHAKWVIVFAQLLSGGENHGVHTFLVRIRNEDMSVVPGTRIEDMGHKIGCNGVDNGKLCVALLPVVHAADHRSWAVALTLLCVSASGGSTTSAFREA